MKLIIRQGSGVITAGARGREKGNGRGVRERERTPLYPDAVVYWYLSGPLPHPDTWRFFSQRRRPPGRALGGPGEKIAPRRRADYRWAKGTVIRRRSGARERGAVSNRNIKILQHFYCARAVRSEPECLHVGVRFASGRLIFVH
ncbi:hypothetical protein EVAR_16679_1 [Eumeta japonica]|uniref:Uncharacterized protein n=1 Tax=Eumeta variegata TaxID=151549 RepID=A0A4C1V499_EUMVA|nr:hypothetical protein EVAR_16679_1 [Eumeta japonica]